MSTSDEQNLDLPELSRIIYPCDVDAPYAFISYCSKDSGIVWNDVHRLQKAGYNLWIDTNLNETDDSWKDGALAAIKDIDCNLVMFYMSRDSVISGPCLEELQCTESDETRNQHGGKNVPWIAIETESIDSLTALREKVFDRIKTDNSIPHEKRSSLASNLTQIMDEFFPDENKIRIKSRDDTSKRYDYYQKIQENLDQNSVEKLSPEKLYDKSMNMFNKPSLYPVAVDILQTCASANISYLPAILALALIYHTGICGKADEDKAREQLTWATFQKDTNEWIKIAEEKEKQHRYEEAIAYYAAYGIASNSSEGFLRAAKMWMKIKNASFELTKVCAKEAGKLNDETGKKLYEGLKNLPENKFQEFISIQRRQEN